MIHRLCVWTALAALTLMVGACGPGSVAPDRSALDRAIGMFIAGDHEAAVRALERIDSARLAENDRRELYYYLGRSYLELGNVDSAIDAFATAVRLGDEGASAAYLERLEGSSTVELGTLRSRERVTRGALAAAIEHALGAPEAEGETPIARLESLGWLESLPDGQPHADAVVTEAAFYAAIAHLVAQRGGPERAQWMETRYGTIDPLSVRPVSGAVAADTLARLVTVK